MMTLSQVQLAQPAPSITAGHPSSPTSSSSSIPLPRSHIHRTPSEIKLAEEVLRAEYDDVRMYARIVGGFQSQCYGSRGLVHPLSLRSLEGVVRTMHASHEELAQRERTASDDWEVSHEQDRDDGDTFLRWSTQTQVPLSKSISELSFPSHESIKNQDKDDDGCIFSLEL
jgi:hypothetical protein